MDLPGKRDDVPETISDEQMAKLSWRAQKSNTESPFSRRNVERRIASSEQQQKKNLS
jgi:hypothetical protein